MDDDPGVQELMRKGHSEISIIRWSSTWQDDMMEPYGKEMLPEAFLVDDFLDVLEDAVEWVSHR
jgi:hypothetical protein